MNSSKFDQMIEMIDNLRNEIDILKDNDKMNQLKIENLEKNLKSKDEIIDKINKEIQLIKMEKENIRENLEDKMKIENDERNIEELFVEIEKEKQERIKSINEINDKSEMIEKRMNKLNKIIDYFDYAMIEWRIDKLDELRKKKDGWIVSEYFSGMKKLYNLQLLFYANGYGDVEGRGCSIYLCICSSSNDKSLTWPFSADVTIKVASKANPNIKKSITKYCQKDKPIDYPYNYSEVFNYLFCDLTEQEENLDNHFIVECFVDFK